MAFPGGVVWKGFLLAPATARVHVASQGFPACFLLKPSNTFTVAMSFHACLCDSCSWEKYRRGVREEEKSPWGSQKHFCAFLVLPRVTGYL